MSEEQVVEQIEEVKTVDVQEMTVAEALAEKLIVMSSDVSKLISEEIEKQKEQLTRQIKADLRKDRTAKTTKGKYSDIQLERYREGTTLTNLDFVRRLITMNVPQKYATVLRDEHMKLASKEIWRIIRDNYQGN